MNRQSFFRTLPPFLWFRMQTLVYVLLLCAGMTACTSIEEKAIRQLWIEKGFGTRAQGIATEENYVAGGDGVVFLIDPTVIQSPEAGQLQVLTAAQLVSLDGTILIPYVGAVKVLGLTERELRTLVEESLASMFPYEIRVQARILNIGKAFYAFGEVQSKGRLPMFKADLTVFEAVATVGTTAMANIGRIRLVRPDAERPLVMDFNMREVVLGGNTTYNYKMQDNDILYVPPTFFGAVARFVEKLVTPLGVVTGALFGAATLRYSYDYAFNDRNDGFFYRF